MYIAFYAPMKAPDHPVPSGDRRMARLLIAALEAAGHEVELAGRLRSWDGQGDRARQVRLQGLGAALARRAVRRFEKRSARDRPEAWFTYHLYYKAPDWIGPQVARALGIPYLVAEASLAHKRAGGPWDLGHRATLAALAQAAAVILLNPTDAEILPHQDRLWPLDPFLDPAPYRAAAARRAQHRARLADDLGLDPQTVWIVAVAMMRPGDKLASYRILAEALRNLADRPWRLILVGDGAERPAVEAAFAWARDTAQGARVHFAGALEGADLARLYAACDLYAWPAVNEAYGMAFLEAQAAGLPVVAGRSSGVPAVVRDGETGLLAPPEDSAAFAVALGALLDDPAKRQGFAAAAPMAVAARHSLAAASRRLDQILHSVVP
jgi:glycosyltransferase involved in cell wall biosynthesis